MLTLIRCPFHPRITAEARKRARSFCQKGRWQVTPKHAYILVPTKSELADHAVKAVLELTCNSSVNAWSQLSQLAEPLWTDHRIKSGVGERELIST